MDDVELVERARRGDERAFSELFARHQRAIFRYAVHMGGAEAGDDVVQETFLTILRRNGRYDPSRGPVIAYLLGIARHLVLKRRVNNVTDTEELDDDAIAKVAWVAATVLDDLTRAETIEAVRAAVQSLPHPYREVVVLCELQEMDYATAAEVMECPIGTVRSRLHRARALLTMKLAAMQPERHASSTV